MHIEPIPAFEDNYIWALRQGAAGGNDNNGCDSRHVAIVDPGEAAPVEAFLQRTGDRLVAILVTHHHGDHTGGIAELRRNYPVPVYGPSREAAEVVTHPLADGASLVLPQLDIAFEVLEVPGHTRGHVVYYAREGWLFCGDTLFGAGCGRVFEGTLAQMHASLARLAALPPDTRIVCAHEYTMSCLRFAKTVEPQNLAIDARIETVQRQRAQQQPSVPSTLAEELATNPFLRWQAPEVIAAATKHLGHPPADDAETFAAIRQWRDQL